MASQYSAQKANPMAAYRFNVKFASSLFTDAGFSRVSGLSVSADTITYREGGQQPTARKMPGMTSFPSLRFERGAGANMDMYTWAAQAFVTNPDASPLPDDYTAGSFRRNLVINALDTDGRTVKRSWQIQSAWCKEVTMGDFDAMSNAVFIETMTVEHEGLIASAGPLGSGSGTAGVPGLGQGTFSISGL